jgi:hypothetical protein
MILWYGLGSLAAWVFIVCVLNLPIQGYAISTEKIQERDGQDGNAKQLNRYFRDTISSLECMRGENGLLADKVFVLPISQSRSIATSCPVIKSYEPTSPTNIAFDLLILMNQKDTKRLSSVLKTISALPFHKKSGLFFNRYSLDQPAKIRDHYISAIDNMHLALALWVAVENGRPPIRSLAQQLLKRMDFSELQDPKSGLIRGGYYLRDGHHHLEDWFYAHFGAESRTLYALGWAINLLPRKVDISKMLIELTYSETDSLHQKPMLRIWDGGTFQMLLTELLIKESNYSQKLKSMYANYSNWVLNNRRDANSPLPAAHSASQIGPLVWTEAGENCGKEPCYLGKAGHKHLISRHNDDRLSQDYSELWERASTLHAVFLSALWNTSHYLPRLLKAENLGSHQQPLYRPGIGWLDSYIIIGNNRNQSVPFQLALDQGMIALTLERMLAKDHENLSSRSIKANKLVQSRLQEIYAQWDEFLK